MLAALLLALQAPAAPPPAEKLALARSVAAASGSVAFLRFAGTAQIEEMAATEPQMTADDRAALVRIGRERSDAILGRLADTLAQSYARTMSDADLEALARYQADPAVVRFRQAELTAMADAVRTLDGVDFKGEVAAAMCAERRRLCDRD